MSKDSMIGKVSKTVAVLAVTVIVGACSRPTPAPDVITLTFIRNAQSEADAAGVINTDIPGPELSFEGKKQAQRVLHQAGHNNNFDSVYASTRAEAQQTAVPIATQLQRRVVILDGLQPIEAGWFNGRPQTMAASTYLLAPIDWVNGDIRNSIPGSMNGEQFNDQFTGAVNKIYHNGHLRPVVFSQDIAIMVWTLMNTKNGNSRLLTEHPLPYIGYVVVTGNPTHGWTLVDWNGIRHFR